MIGQEGRIDDSARIGADHLAEGGCDPGRAAALHSLQDRRCQREVEVHRHLVAAADRGGGAVVEREVGDVGGVLGDQHRLGSGGAHVGSELFEERVRIRGVRLADAGPGLHQIACGVEAESIDALPQPQACDAKHLRLDRWVAVVEVGHPVIEHAVVERAILGVPGRAAAPGLLPSRIGGAPDVPVAFRRRG